MNDVSGIVRMNIAGMSTDDLLLLRRALDINCRTGYSDAARAEATGIIAVLTDEIRRRFSGVTA
jgi:hypothetical protein